MKKKLFAFWLILTPFWLGLFTGFGTESANGSDLPTRVATSTPTPLPSSFSEGPGGLIILRAATASLAPEGLWTRVQWQDYEGNWHQVEGWQGEFNHDFEVIWWVAPENLGEGPFRWLVYEKQESDNIVGVSEPFYLPGHQRAITRVTVTLLN